MTPRDLPPDVRVFVLRRETLHLGVVAPGGRLWEYRQDTPYREPHVWRTWPRETVSNWYQQNGDEITIETAAAIVHANETSLPEGF